MDDSPQTGTCGCHVDEKRAARDPAYRRALWIVVLLNLGYGVVEMVGGFIARSQALSGFSWWFGVIVCGKRCDALSGWSLQLREHG